MSSLMRRFGRLSATAFALLTLLLSGCGNAEPQTADAWLTAACAHYPATGFETEFQMQFSLQENQRTVEVSHGGSLQELDAQHYRLQATTRMTLPDLGNQQTEIRNLQVADGEFLWMQSDLQTMPQPAPEHAGLELPQPMPQAMVLIRALAEIEDLATVDPLAANQLSPSDLNPMLMWRLALQHGDFELAPSEPGDVIQLLSAATPAFLIAAAHRAEFFQPQQLRIQLHAPTHAPMSLEILSADGSVTWKNTFKLWRAISVESSEFTYAPPPGAQVLTQ